MKTRFLSFAAIAGALAVLAGALLAHQLKSKLPENSMMTYETAVRYQFYHVFALLTTGLLTEKFTGAWINRAGNCFMAGIILFCGSLYLISFMTASGNQVPAIIGILTPLGGLAFISGWIFLAISILRGRSS